MQHYCKALAEADPQLNINIYKDDKYGWCVGVSGQDTSNISFCPFCGIYLDSLKRRESLMEHIATISNEVELRGKSYEI